MLTQSFVLLGFKPPMGKMFSNQRSLWLRVWRSFTGAAISTALVGLSWPAWSSQPALDFLNQARLNNNMVPFQLNQQLFKAADNHVLYMAANNLTEHDEIQGQPSFTGTSCLDRIGKTGYPSAMCIENLSSGEADLRTSAEGLMTAIYHRISFFSFQVDEIGYAMRQGHSTQTGHPHNYFGFVMGSSALRSACEQASPATRYGYSKVCRHDDLYIPADRYLQAKDALALRSGEFAIYPWHTQTQVWPQFDNVESPDPLPGIELSGQPISIHFNPVRLQNKTIRIDHFQLLNPQGEAVALLPSKNRQTDPLFSAYDFAWFPELPLDWNTTYRAELSYSIDNQPHTLNWSFTTATTPIGSRGVTSRTVLLKPGHNKLKLKRAKLYTLQLSPEMQNSRVCSYNAIHHGGIWLEKTAFDRIDLQAPTNATLTLSMCNGEQHEVVIEGR